MKENEKSEEIDIDGVISENEKITKNKFPMMIVSIVALVMILFVSYFGYKYLSKDYNNSQKAGSNAVEQEDVPLDNETEPKEKSKKDTALMYADFETEDFDGNKIQLSDYIGSECVVINFWASWCGYCDVEMPDFLEAAEMYKEKGVVFLMVNSTDGTTETKEVAKTYLEENDFDFENILYDTEFQASIAYGVRGLPSTLFIDKEGYVVAGRSGAMSETELTQTLDSILSGDYE